MNWIPLKEESQLDDIKATSAQQPVVIFKHSTRCAISSMVKSRLERQAAPKDLPFYYLDLISYRNISNRIADTFAVEHESPQVLLIRDGKCVYDESHNGISMDEIVKMAS
ncbi:bacillithiol system redox-active protein YtxJ [Chitinophaga agrisoli]|uniref:Bacillithiol system redox-active protein YtxJ n=1 Tax=Chitinophaga agrisoli TaxID=2607653 RepID=A0A5B2W051_9BACT|nr:bacillithiol system redox-active protein YtxJ [Chitinophaga agrisoli]KAA2243689.1 bacillithiol system redox-active protein YtxJ [Chitinophaga agrisoli]